MVNTSPKFATSYCIASTQAQPILQQQSTTQISVVSLQLPTVVVRPLTTPKSYRGDASYKACSEYFERLSVCNGWVSPMQKAQNLIISLEGPAADCLWP